MTTSFFVPPDRFSGDICSFPPEEAHHLTRVLRHQTGDFVRVVDGQGCAYIVELRDVGKDRAVGRVVERHPGDGEPAIHVTIAAALLKQRSRYEMFLEKAVELGAAEVIPLITDRTEKGSIRIERAENLLLSAMKQSGRSRLPKIHEPLSIAELLATGLTDGEGELRVVCHESADGSPELLSVLRREKPRRVTMLVGPEGGFSEGEIGACEAAGFAQVRLGPRRLRAETAAIAAVTACMFYDSEFNTT